MKEKTKNFLCSKEMIDAYGKEVRRSEYLERYGEKVCIAELNFDKVLIWYDKYFKKHPEANVWIREIVPCNISIKNVTYKELKKTGLFVWIMEQFQIGVERNVAAIIGGLCEKKSINPIRLFNKLAKK